MTCDRCANRGFELVGVEPGGVVCLRCDRCGRVERVVADRRPPQQAVASRYLSAQRGSDQVHQQAHQQAHQPVAPPA